jgi:hypothetical protein
LPASVTWEPVLKLTKNVAFWPFATDSALQ